MKSPYNGDHILFKSDNSQNLENDYGFNEFYEKLKTGSEDFEILSSELRNSVELIFNAIEKKSEDINHILFLEELKYEVIGLLKDDLEFFKSKNSGKHFKSPYNVHFERDKCITTKLYPFSTWLINLISKNTINKFLKKAKNGLTKREDLSVNSGLLNWVICQILNLDFYFKGVNSLISNYTGVKYNVGGLSLELSVSTSKWWESNYSSYSVKPKTNYYHFDESVSKPKAIVYLSNVSRKNGPVMYVNKFNDLLNVTHLQHIVGRVIGNVGRSNDSKIAHLFKHKYHQTFGCPKFISFFNTLPEQLKFSSHIGWDIIPESKLESEILKNEKVLLGEKGTALVFDGSELLHRGGMVEENIRISLQVIFERKVKFSLIKKVTKFFK